MHARLRSSTAAILLTALLAVPCLATAQDAPPSLRQPGANLFAPAPGHGNYLQVDGTRFGGSFAPTFGAMLDYAHHPLTLYDATCVATDPTNCTETGTNRVLVESLATANLWGAVTLFDRVQIGLVLPVSFSSGDLFQYTRTDSMGAPHSTVVSGGGSGVGLGDARVSAKVRLFGNGDLAFAVNVYGTIPLGSFLEAKPQGAGPHFLGDYTMSLGGYAIGEFNHDKIHIAVNVGGFWRDNAVFLSTNLGSRLTYAVAAAYDFTPLFSVVAELVGQASFTGQVDENPLEVRAAGRLNVGDLQFTLGAGAGLIQGVGVPMVRILGGVSYVPDRADSDGDGVPDARDSCPNVAEDRDGWDDEDGCPDPDNDSDGIADAQDHCPDEAEDRDGHDDADGCPDTDDDHDGVADGYDACPEQAEDHVGNEPNDGCPDLDRDHDGVPNDHDQCPDQPEDTDGFCDEDGCPETDCDHDGLTDDNDQCPDQAENFNHYQDDDGCPDEVTDSDGDGIADPVDHCPHEPETLNGIADDDGCPDGPALVRIEGNNIILLQQVNFRTNSATITGRRSFTILDIVGAIVHSHPEYAHIGVEGHTDNHGDHDANVTLSQNRAQACVDYLTQHGLEASRLTATGFGPDRPIDQGTGRRADAANRRVEFHITADAAAPGTPAAAPPATPAATPATPATPAAAPPADAAATPPADAAATPPADGATPPADGAAPAADDGHHHRHHHGH